MKKIAVVALDPLAGAYYTKEVRAQIKDHKYAPNNKGYAQDYIGISISAKNVNAIKYGNSWTCSTT